MDTITLIALITGITGALSGISSAAYSFYKQSAEKKKLLTSAEVDRADAAKTITEASSSLIETYRKESEETREEIRNLECEVRNLKVEVEKLKVQNQLLIRGIAILLKQLERLQIKPEWEPSEEEIALMQELKKEGEL